MAEFNAVVREAAGVSVVDVAGYLDAHTAPKLESTFSELIEKNKFRVVVNFKDLDYISSAGLGIFMAFIEPMRDGAGDIKLTEMKSSVYNIFDLLGFPLLYEIYEKEEDAVNKFIQKL